MLIWLILTESKPLTQLLLREFFFFVLHNVFEIAASGYSKLQMLLTDAGTHNSLTSSTTLKLF